MLYLNPKRDGSFSLSYHGIGNTDCYQDWDEFMIRFPQSVVATMSIDMEKEDVPYDVMERISMVKALANEKKIQQTILTEKILDILKENGECTEVLEELPTYILRAKFSHEKFEFDADIDGNTETFTIEDPVMGWYLEEDEHPMEYTRNSGGLFNIYEDQSAMVYQNEDAAKEDSEEDEAYPF